MSQSSYSSNSIITIRILEDIKKAVEESFEEGFMGTDYDILVGTTHGRHAFQPLLI